MFASAAYFMNKNMYNFFFPDSVAKHRVSGRSDDDAYRTTAAGPPVARSIIMAIII